MKSKRVGHGLKWAVCGALLSASTFAAAAPRELSAAGLARLSSLTLPEVVTTEGVTRSTLHPTLAGVTGRQEILVRLSGQSVAGSGESVTREQVQAEQAAFINRALALAPSAEVIASTQLALNAVMLRVDAADLGLLVRTVANPALRRSRRRVYANHRARSASADHRCRPLWTRPASRSQCTRLRHPHDRCAQRRLRTRRLHRRALS